MPTAADTGFPPNEEKNSMPFANAAAISGVVMTAAIGWPFPIGLPSVTMSGTTPCSSCAHICVPTRPKPVCTSSTIIIPPAWRMERAAASR